MEEHPAEGPEEGWFTDPYGLHEARWLSNGEPTKLVRDAGVDSYDEPPTEPPSQKPIAIGVENHLGNVDMLRADDVDKQSYDPSLIQEAPYGQMLGVRGSRQPEVCQHGAGGLKAWLLSNVLYPLRRKDRSHRWVAEESDGVDSGD